MSDQQLPSFKEIRETLTSGNGDPRSIILDANGKVTMTGYTPGEVARLLESIRDHTRDMSNLAREINSTADAVRYTPVGPEDIGMTIRPSESVPETFRNGSGLDDARPR